MYIDFEGLFPERILQRGYDYYCEGSVTEVSRTGQVYEALIYGTETYNVKIVLDDNQELFDMDCDCPYARENNCKHMVALLYHIQNDEEVSNKKKVQSKETFEKIIDKIDEKDIEKFILGKLEKDIDFQNEFRSEFVRYFDKTPREVYAKRIDRSIYEVMGRNGFIAYNETYKFSRMMDIYINEAEQLILHGEYEAPFWIASLILESLSEMAIDDSDGCTSIVAGACRDVLEQILDNCKDEQMQKQIFDWIIDSLKSDSLSNYSCGIEKILDEYFQDENSIELKLEMLNEKLATLKEGKGEAYYGEYSIVACLETIIALLYQLEKDEEAEKIIRENTGYTSILITLIDLEERRGNKKEVIRLLKEGLENNYGKRYRGNVAEFAERLLKSYKELDMQEEYKELISNILFKYIRGRFKYYIMLKELYSKEQWDKKRDKIISIFEKDEKDYSSDYLRKIYIEEGYHKKLFESVIKLNYFEMILEYEKHLRPNYEKELLSQYEKLINEQAKYTGKNNYYSLRKMLEHLKTFDDGVGIVDRLVQEYRVKYKNRRLMLEELDRI